jgi:hypothetical protein
MPKAEVFITFGVTQEEKKLLKKYCQPQVSNQIGCAKNSD